MSTFRTIGHLQRIYFVKDSKHSFPSGSYQHIGLVTGKFYNSHTRVEDWKQAPGWVSTHYRMEEEQRCGDISKLYSGTITTVLAIEYSSC